MSSAIGTATVESPIGTILIAGDDRGLRRIGFQNGATPVRRLPEWSSGGRIVERAARQIEAYFEGRLREFDLPLLPEGTAFQLEVWRALLHVPYGTLISYRDLAARIGRPAAARAAGGAVGRNPLPIVIPCHRVIGSDGGLGGFTGGLFLKERLIEIERGAPLALRA